MVSTPSADESPGAKVTFIRLDPPGQSSSLYSPHLSACAGCWPRPSTDVLVVQGCPGRLQLEADDEEGRRP